MGTIRVLVFGSSGTGKTSLCNCVSGMPGLRPTSDSSVGCTFESFEYPSFKLDGHDVILTDTVGLNENERGTVATQESLKQLLSLLKNSREGYNLLVQVIKIPRIHQNVVDNYQLFVQVIADHKIPTILVATGCENIDPMSKWVTDNLEHITNAGLRHRTVLASCFAADGRYNFSDLRSESTNALRDAILRHASPAPIRIYSKDGSFISTAKRVWNWMVKALGFPKLRVAINDSVRALLRRLGLKDEEVEQAVEELSS